MTFGLELSLKELQTVFFDGKPINDALEDGWSLAIDTWGCQAELVLDPIDISIPISSQAVSIRDSLFAVGIDLRSNGSYSSTVANLTNADSSQLLPNVAIPVSAEILIDLTVGNIAVSPK